MSFDFTLSLRERVLFIVILLIFLLAFNKLWIDRQDKKIVALLSQIKSKKSQIQKSNKLMQELHAKSVDSISSTKKKPQYEKYLEANRYLSNLIRNLGTESRGGDIHLQRMYIDGHKKVSDFFRSSFKLDVEVSFKSLGEFLGEIGGSKLLIEVKSIKLTRIDKELKRCNATIEIYGYYQAGGA